jgi:hypothetical protein
MIITNFPGLDTTMDLRRENCKSWPDIPSDHSKYKPRTQRKHGSLWVNASETTKLTKHFRVSSIPSFFINYPLIFLMAGVLTKPKETIPW